MSIEAPLFEATADLVRTVIESNQRSGRQWVMVPGDPRQVVPVPQPDRGFTGLELELLASIQVALVPAWYGALVDGAPAHHLVTCSACDSWSLSAKAPGVLAKARCIRCSTKGELARIDVEWGQPSKRGRPTGPGRVPV